MKKSDEGTEMTNDAFRLKHTRRKRNEGR